MFMQRITMAVMIAMMITMTMTMFAACCCCFPVNCQTLPKV